MILSISPTSKEEYLLKFPPADKIASPIATEQEENTEMMVSVEARFALLILFKSSANITAKITMDMVVSRTPQTTPTAIPVKAE